MKFWLMSCSCSTYLHNAKCVENIVVNVDGCYGSVNVFTSEFCMLKWVADSQISEKRFVMFLLWHTLERKRDRQTDRQTDKQTDRERERDWHCFLRKDRKAKCAWKTERDRIKERNQDRLNRRSGLDPGFWSELGLFRVRGVAHPNFPPRLAFWVTGERNIPLQAPNGNVLY